MSQSPNSAADPSDYGYYPKISLALGRGFNPADITGDAKRPCLEAPKKPSIEVRLDSGPPSTRLSTAYVRNFDELTEASHFDAKASAEVLDNSGNASFSIDTQSAFARSSASVLVSAITDYGRWGLDPSTVLTLDAKKLLTDPDQFEEVCGSRYVVFEERASSANVLITIENVSRTWKQTMEGHAGASGNLGPLTAEATANFNSELKRAAKQNRVTVQVFATGGAGFASLGQLAKTVVGDPDPLRSLGDGLSKFMESFSSANAAVISYKVASMTHFGWKPKHQNTWTDLKENQLREIAVNYKVAEQELAGEKDYVTGIKWRNIHGDQYLESVKILIPKMEEFLVDSKKAYEACKVSGLTQACTVPTLPYCCRFLVPPAPEISFGVQPKIVEDLGNGSMRQQWLTELSGDISRQILNSGQSQWLQSTRQFSPQANAALITLHCTAGYPEFASVIFIDEDGLQRTVVAASPILAQGYSWSGIPVSQNELGTLLPLVNTWVKSSWAGTGDTSGTFYLDLHDKLGREFRLALVDVKITVLNGSPNEISWAYVH